MSVIRCVGFAATARTDQPACRVTSGSDVPDAARACASDLDPR